MNPKLHLSYTSVPELLQYFGVAMATFDEAGRLTGLSPSLSRLLGKRAEHFSRVGSTLALTVIRRSGTEEDVASALMPDGCLRLEAHRLCTNGREAAVVVVHAARSEHPLIEGDTWGLSRREAEVASLIGGGASTRTIATALGISAHTVRRHTERVFTKVGVHRRQELIRLLARREKWVESPIGSRTKPETSSPLGTGDSIRASA
jgi:DNA-binding CsgD family transcriptional regulator